MSTGHIHHIEMNVFNLGATIRFWGWLLEDLGYTVFQKWDKGQSWKLGDIYRICTNRRKIFRQAISSS